MNCCIFCKSKKIAGILADVENFHLSFSPEYPQYEELENIILNGIGLDKDREDEVDSLSQMIHFSWCLDCGQIQNKFPIARNNIDGSKLEKEWKQFMDMVNKDG